MRKAGAAFQADIKDWFNALDHTHVLAYRQFEITGEWPSGFLGSEVWLSPGWEQFIKDKLAVYPMTQETQDILNQFEKVQAIVKNVTFPGYSFRVGMLNDRVYVQITYKEKDVFDGAVEDQWGREWVVAKNPTVGQVVQTCFKAVLTSMEHRTREHFLYRRKPVLQPHLDIDKLWDMMPDREVQPDQIAFEGAA